MSIGDKDLTQRAQIKRYFWTANCELRLQPSHPKDNSNQQFLKQKKTIIYRSNHFWLLSCQSASNAGKASSDSRSM